MEEMYGVHSSGYDYADKALLSPENMMMAAEYSQYHHHYDSLLPVFDQQVGLIRHSSESAASVTHHHVHQNQRGEFGESNNNNNSQSVIKARIASHPSYPKLLHAYIDCQKVGAPPEIACLLDEISRGKHDFKLHTDAANSNNMCCLGLDPELDHFMEAYCDILVKYKADLSRPFDEATSFLNNIQNQLGNLCTADNNSAISSDEELSGGEMDQMEDQRSKTEDQELKDRLLRMYGNHINNLKIEFSKKKKKGKLPKEAKLTLLEWWNVHYKWPYPTEADKISLAEMTGLDQKQINNWFINQRKRHWKPSDNMHLAMMDSLSGHFCMNN